MVMGTGMGMSTMEVSAKGCFACSPLPPGPDRDQCPCRAPVGLACIGAILEPPPAEPGARLEHLRRQAQLAAGAREYAEREAVLQDRCDQDHARDLRTTSTSYAHVERRLRGEIERLERELSTARSKPATKAKKSSRQARRGNTRRAPGRAPRPAGRRAAAQQRQAAADGGGGGDGDPPSGDPDPAPSAGPARAISPARPPFKAPGLPGGAARARAIELTIAFWSARLGRRISEEEARQILERMAALDALLGRWRDRPAGGAAP